MMKWLDLDSMVRRIFMHPHHYSHQPLPGKWHQNPRPHDRHFSAHFICKQLVQRNRQCKRQQFASCRRQFYKKKNATEEVA